MDLPNFSLEDGDFGSLFLTQESKPMESNVSIEADKPQYSDISDDDLMDFEIPCSQSSIVR